MTTRLLNTHSPALNKFKLAVIKGFDHARYGPQKKFSYDEIMAKLDMHKDLDLDDTPSAVLQAEDA